MVKKEKKFNTIVALHDPAHCLAPGLFRSLKKGQRKNTKLDITYSFGTESIRIIGYEPLGADDLKLLQGIIGLAGPNGLLLSPQPETQSAQQLRLSLNPKFDAANKDTLVVKESLATLLREIGITRTGSSIRNLKNSLTRMSNVTFIISSANKHASFHLLSFLLDENEGKFLIAINPRLADAILGHRPHTRIEMNEVRALRSDLALLIHQRLCGWIKPNSSGKITLASLTRYCFPQEAKPATERQRQKRIRCALQELSNLPGWSINEYIRNKFQITRPNQPH